MNPNEIFLSCKEFGHFDLVVVGGSCTGVFAAVRAARLGLRVAILEKNNCFGGVATAGLSMSGTRCTTWTERNRSSPG